MRLPNDLEKRLRRFTMYLAETDARSLRQGIDTCSFEGLRKQIHSLAFLTSYQDPPSRLTYTKAGEFARTLGADLMAHAALLHKEMSVYDWHTVCDIADLARLGWEIQYYNEC